MKRIFSGLFILSLVILTGFAVSSCNKKHDTIAKIKVLDVDGLPVGGAEVRIYGEPTDSLHTQPDVVLDDTATTDATGYAVFNFNEYYQEGQAGMAVLSIDVTDPSGVKYENIGIVKVIEEETVEETVQY